MIYFNDFNKICICLISAKHQKKANQEKTIELSLFLLFSFIRNSILI